MMFEHVQIVCELSAVNFNFESICLSVCTDEIHWVHMWLCVCVSEVESSQQPAEEASPLGSEEADKEVNHRGDEDDACSKVVQVIESFLIGHHI